MKQADLEATERVLASQGAFLQPLTVGVLSPSVDELAMLQRCFPFSTVTSLWLSHWDLSSGPYHETFDLLVASNVFMASPNVELWLKNALSSCKTFLLQDIVLGWRGSDRELGNDGDKTRFSFALHGNVARIDGAYDMTKWSNDITEVEFYDDDPGFRKHDGREMETLKFVALFQRPALVKEIQEPAHEDAPDVVSVHDDTQGADVSEPVAEEAGETRLDGAAADRDVS